MIDLKPKYYEFNTDRITVFQQPLYIILFGAEGNFKTQNWNSVLKFFFYKSKIYNA